MATFRKILPCPSRVNKHFNQVAAGLKMFYRVNEVAAAELITFTIKTFKLVASGLTTFTTSVMNV